MAIAICLSGDSCTCGGRSGRDALSDSDFVRASPAPGSRPGGVKATSPLGRRLRKCDDRLMDHVPAEDTVLHVGHELSWQPYMRVERARGLSLALAADIRCWARSGAAIGWLHPTDDPLRLDLVLQVNRVPPMTEWSMRVGEALHHLRAAMDGLAWDIAHMNGAVPADPRRVEFPVCPAPSAWSRACKFGTWLADIPADLRARVEALQPFNQPDGFLAQAHSMNIADKHRGLLSGRGQVAGFETTAFALDAGKVDPAEFDLRFETPEVGPVLEDGAKLAWAQLSHPLGPGGIIRSGPIEVEIDFVLRFEEHERTVYDITHNMADEALGVIDFIRTGLDMGEWAKSRRPRTLGI